MVALVFNPSTLQQGRKIMNLRPAVLNSTALSKKNKDVKKLIPFEGALYATRHINTSAL